MTAVEFHRLTTDAESTHARGWLISLLCHVLGVGSALLLMAEFEKPALTNPFQWDVAVVEAPAPPSAAEPVQQQPVKQAVRSQPREKSVVPVEQEVHEVAPSVEAREPVQQVTHEVVATAEISTERPAVQSTEPHAVIARAVTTSQESVVEQVSAQVAVSSVVERAQPVDAPTSIEAVPQAVERDSLPVEAASPAVEHRLVQQRVIRHREIHADYGWLSDALWHRIEELKRYPAQAKINHWEGKVVVEAVIRDDGEVIGLSIAESSGRTILDQEAMAVMKKASPLALKHPLGKPRVTIFVPISYRLDG